MFSSKLILLSLLPLEAWVLVLTQTIWIASVQTAGAVGTFRINDITFHQIITPFRSSKI